MKKLLDEQRKALEEKEQENIFLKTEIKKLETILELTPGNLYWKDRNHRYQGCNKSLADEIKISYCNDIKGKFIENYVDRENAKEITDYDEDVMKNNKIIEVEETGFGGRVFLTKKTPMRDEDGTVNGLIGLSMDITEIKKTEMELREAKEAAEMASRVKTDFLENMRHDIRTPLTGIVGFAELIKDATKDKKIKEYAENLTTSSHALLEFLNDVLESIRSISADNGLNKQKFDLKAKIEHVLQLNKATALSKKIALEFEYDEKIPKYLIGDSKRIYRIVLELLTNALKYTPQGTIKISTSLVSIDDTHSGNMIIKVSISDTGIGIPESQQQAIFTRFHRLTHSSKGIYSGLGMGLAIVKQFIDNLDAEIYVDSVIDKGSTFTCLIPLKKALTNDDVGAVTSFESSPAKQTNNPSTTVKPEKASKTKTEVGKSHILLVEDQPFAAQVVHDMLVTLDCNVDIAENGKVALQYVQKNEYDLIFMDIGLPDIDGNEITERIRSAEEETAIHIPIIALTAHIDEENRKRCIQAGMDAVLSKPLGKETAEDILRAFIPTRPSSEKPKQKKGKPDSPKNADSDFLTIDGLVIDLALGAKKLGCDKASAKKMIGNLLSSAESDMEIFDKAHKNEDWNTIREIAHKTKGGASYCGTPRIYQAFSHLNDYLKTGETELAEALYQQAVEEMDKLKKEYKP